MCIILLWSNVFAVREYTTRSETGSSANLVGDLKVGDVVLLAR